MYDVYFCYCDPLQGNFLCEKVKPALCDVIEVKQRLSLVCENVPLEVLAPLPEVNWYWPPSEPSFIRKH